MDLTPEQLQSIVDSVLEKAKSSMQRYLQKMVEDLDIPDVRNMATKKFVSDAIDALKTGFNDEFKKTNEAVTKVAEETDTKIKALTPPASKPWYSTVLDYES